MICQRFPPDNQVKGIIGTQLVSAIEPTRWHLWAFSSWKKFEATLESEEQSLENVQIDRLDEFLLVALSCRAKRQQNLVNSVKAFVIPCNNKTTIDALFTLMEHCQEICFFESSERKKRVGMGQAFQLVG